MLPSLPFFFCGIGQPIHVYLLIYLLLSTKFSSKGRVKVWTLLNFCGRRPVGKSEKRISRECIQLGLISNLR
jgi:hypothetical protein